MSTVLTTRVLDDPDGDGSYWPFVTYPNFPALAGDVRNASGAIQVTYAPVVKEEERLEFEWYTVDHQGWLIEEEHTDYYRNRNLRLLQKTASNSTGSRSTSMGRIEQEQQSSSSSAYTSTEKMLDVESLRYPPQPDTPPIQNQRRQHEDHNLRGVVPARIHPTPTREERLNPDMRYAPVWQMSPPPYYRGIVLHDLYREPSFQRLSQIVNDTRQAIISNQLDDDLVDLLLKEHNAQKNVFSGAYPTADHSHGKKPPPCSVLIQPVWDDVAISNPNLIGYLIALIPWGAYLVDSYRPGSDEAILGRYAEVDCASDELLNYELQGGDKVQYLEADEDFSRFDFAMESKMYFPATPTAKPSQTQLLAETPPLVATSAPSYQLDSSSDDEPGPTDCNIQIRLYPSDELRDRYLTKWPIYYALMIFAIFFILSLAFFLYDFIVERRRGRAMAVAEKTGRIVTNLFPGQFADQLIAEDKQREKDAKKKKKKNKKVVIEEAPNRQLKKFMDKNPMSEREGSSAFGLEEKAGESPLFLAQSKPIADLFPGMSGRKLGKREMDHPRPNTSYSTFLQRNRYYCALCRYCWYVFNGDAFVKLIFYF